MPFLIVAGWLCAAPQITNSTMEPWNSNDQWNFETAQRRCGEKYGDRSPCLKNFEKVGERDYKATCAAALKKQ